MLATPHPARESQPEQLTVKNFAMLIFSWSDAPLTSASAVSFSAGGPVGISIMENHKIGSSERRFVLVANAHMMGIDMLKVSMSAGERPQHSPAGDGTRNLRRPDYETHRLDKHGRAPGDMPSLLVALALLHRLERVAQLHPDNHDLQRRE